MSFYTFNDVRSRRQRSENARRSDNLRTELVASSYKSVSSETSHIETLDCQSMSRFSDSVLAFLLGRSAYHMELRTFGMALQGAMAVRNGPNKDLKMHWFHAFALATIIAFGGGWFTFIWMGKPTSMIASGDVNVTLAFIAFVITHYTPFDIGYKIANSLPGVLAITSLAQMFRSMGTIGFISSAASELNPSPYYPIPVIGPILYGSLLGNMGGFFRKGFDGYLQNGIPWPFQNGTSDFVIDIVYHWLTARILLLSEIL
eukprot:scaffold23539_cov137-Cylindrotheca_fusiformis.AAC.5